MTDVDASALPELFGRYAERFAAEKQALIELDGKVGDSDLGLTMAKGFAAADAALAEAAPDSLSAGMKTAGAAIAKAAPSTMGTLMATGFLRGSKALEAASVLDAPALAAFWGAFRDGIAQRGKAKWNSTAGAVPCPRVTRGLFRDESIPHPDVHRRAPVASPATSPATSSAAAPAAAH